MPYSLGVFDEEVRYFLSVTPATTYLDIGAGAGKYGTMIRGLHGKEVSIEAFEPESKYVTEFNLDSIYDKVSIDFVGSLIDNNPDYTVDVVVMGDVIEHMRKSEGIDFLNYIVYRCKWVLVIYPLRYIQGAWEGHRTEAHRSIWGWRDFEGFDVIQKLSRGNMEAVFIKGYRE